MNESGLFFVRDVLFNGNQDPDLHAIECPGHRPLTYRDLRSQIAYVVKTLNSLGFCRNDRIAVITPAGPETAVIVISVMAGFTSVPLNPQSREQEYAWYFSRMKIKAVIVQQGCDTAAVQAAAADNIAIIELIPRTGHAGIFSLNPAGGPDAKEPEFAVPSDTAILLLTSGTTGTQKIVPVTQRQFLLSKHRDAVASEFTRADRSLHILPYYHGLGLSTPLLSLLLAGGTVICTRDFIPSDFLPLLRDFRPSYYSATPALHQAILKELKKVSSGSLKGSSLRMIRTGSAPLSATVNQELEEVLGVPVIEGFGSSETGTIAVNNPPRKGSVGIPFIESLIIRDERGNALGSGEIGEIVLIGETVFSGYENSPEDRTTALSNGWFRTGDMGYLDNDGYLFLTGRKKEIINKGGEKISPVEVDSVLLSHPFVKWAMVFPVQDPVLGEDIAAMVVRADGEVTETELRRYLLDRLAPFKVPCRIYFTEEIPRTATGKPRRIAGTERYSEPRDRTSGQTSSGGDRTGSSRDRRCRPGSMTEDVYFPDA